MTDKDKDLQPKTSETLSIKYVLGYRNDFRNNIFVLQDNTSLIYPAGNLIVINNNENKPRFIHTLPGTRGISCMAQSPNKRYLAFAEVSDPPTIGIVDLKSFDKQNEKGGNDKDKMEVKRVRTLQALDVKASQFISIDFSKSKEDKYLVALTGGPEFQLVHFEWSKNKYIGSTIIKVSPETQRFTHCFYYPKEEDYVIVMGTGALKHFKLYNDQPPKALTIAKNVLKDLQHSTNYLSYCILKDNSMIVGTDMGELLYFNSNGEFKNILPQSPRQEQFSINCLLPYSKGFLVGGQDCTVLIYEKFEGDHKNPYKQVDKKIQNLKKEFRYPINALLLLGGEENLVLGLENKQILSVAFTSERQIQEDNQKFEHVGLPFHSEKITGLDVCIRKSLVATCSSDKTVRVWNYMEYTLENFKEFEEEAQAVAFHPSGFHLIVAFVDKIRLMNLFEHDIIPFKEIPAKNCREISFSNGGHLFALNNNQVIYVYQFYTGRQAHFIKVAGSGSGTGGSQSKVNSICWEEDDQGFYTGSSDGQVHYCPIEENHPAPKQEIFSLAGFQVTCVSTCINNSDRYVYVSGFFTKEKENDSEKCMFQIKVGYEKNQDNATGNNNQKKMQSESKQSIMTGANIGQIKVAQQSKMLIYATDEKNKPGSIRISKAFFLNDAKEGASVHELATHLGPITRVQISSDETYAFSTGEDGTLIVYQMVLDIKKYDKDMVISPADEFLMQRQLYNDQIQENTKLQHQIQALKFRQEQMDKEEDRRKKEKHSELQRQLKELEENEKRKISNLEQEQSKMKEDFEKKKKMQLDQHEDNRRKLEQDHKKKIALEMSKNEELQDDKEKDFNKFQQEMENLDREHKRTVKEITEKYEKYLEKEKQEYQKLYKLKEERTIQFNNERDELEKHAEDQIEQLKESSEKQMKKLFEELDECQGQKIIKKTEYETGQQHLEEQRSKLKEIMETITNTSEQNKQLKKETESHEKEKQEREKTLQDKQRRIYELKKKTQELEKFKFVLDYKIKELKRDIGPKEEEIAKMKEQISNMNSEIMHFNRTNANLRLIVTDLRLRQSGMVEENDKNETQINKNAAYIASYEQDIADAYQEIGDYKRLKKKCLELYNKYVVADDKRRMDIADRKDNKDFIKERAYLESTVTGLKEKFQKNAKVNIQDNARIMKQNVKLISDINDLKREKKNLQDEAKRVEDEGKLQKNKQQLGPELEALERQIEINEEEKQNIMAEIEDLKRLNETFKQQMQI